MRVSHILLAAALCLGSSAICGAAEFRGLSIGIDHYPHGRSLRGAVNDAQWIAATLNEVGATDVMLLTDNDASHDAIFDALTALLARAGKGDTIVLSYSGHGAQVPNEVGGDAEEDGLDEIWVLGGFSGEGSNEYILDDEIYEWVKAASQKGAQVVLVWDSCHAGAQPRSVDARACPLPDRLSSKKPGSLDLSRRRPAPKPRLDADYALPNLIYLGASPDNEKVNEVFVSQVRQVHGALSYSFARALRELSGRVPGGVVESAELVSLVREGVRQLDDYRQLPQIYRGSEITFNLRPQQAERPELTIPNISLAVMNGEVPTQLPGAFAVGKVDNSCGFVWDRAKGEVISNGGDIVASVVETPKRMETVLLKHRLVEGLKILMADRPLVAKSLVNRCVRKIGDTIDMVVGGATNKYWTVFGLDALGNVNFYYPLKSEGDAAELPPGIDFNPPGIAIGKPAGAETVVAIASEEQAAHLHAALEQAHGRPLDETFVASLKQFLKQNRSQIGLQTFVYAETLPEPKGDQSPCN